MALCRDGGVGGSPSGAAPLLARLTSSRRPSPTTGGHWPKKRVCTQAVWRPRRRLLGGEGGCRDTVAHVTGKPEIAQPSPPALGLGWDRAPRVQRGYLHGGSPSDHLLESRGRLQNDCPGLLSSEARGQVAWGTAWRSGLLKSPR